MLVNFIFDLSLLFERPQIQFNWGVIWIVKGDEFQLISVDPQSLNFPIFPLNDAIHLGQNVVKGCSSWQIFLNEVVDGIRII